MTATTMAVEAHEERAAAVYERASTDRKPTAKQVYAMARDALALLDLDWPTSRKAASETIAALREQREPTGDDCPF